LASGSFMDAAINIMKNPQRRRFRINPAFQFSVLVIPQVEGMDDLQTCIERISFRAICFVEESVCIGISYDGPSSDVMYDLSEKLDETLLNIPQMCGWGDQYSATLENGLEDIWRAKQKNKQNETNSESCEDKVKIAIAQVQTFILTEEGINEVLNNKNHMLDSIVRV
ncbi:MAG: hypothetical protein EZS28_054185, partial [Streblomastix strix]